MGNYLPLNSSNTEGAKINQINSMIAQLNQEQRVKVFKQDQNTNAIINGKLPYDGGYGSLYYDSDGVPNTIIGILPDGTTGIVVAREGVDATSLFS